MLMMELSQAKASEVIITVSPAATTKHFYCEKLTRFRRLNARVLSVA
jgi:hypothetical protein